jgi:hypothetical protein
MNVHPYLSNHPFDLCILGSTVYDIRSPRYCDRDSEMADYLSRSHCFSGKLNAAKMESSFKLLEHVTYKVKK